MRKSRRLIDMPEVIKNANRRGYRTPIEAIKDMVEKGVKRDVISSRLGLSVVAIRKYAREAGLAQPKEPRVRIEHSNIHQTKNEIDLMRSLHSRGKLRQYYEALKNRVDWDGMDRDEVMNAAEDMIGGLS